MNTGVHWIHSHWHQFNKNYTVHKEIMERFRSCKKGNSSYIPLGNLRVPMSNFLRVVNNTLWSYSVSVCGNSCCYAMVHTCLVIHITSVALNKEEWVYIIAGWKDLSETTSWHSESILSHDGIGIVLEHCSHYFLFLNNNKQFQGKSAIVNW